MGRREEPNCEEKHRVRDRRKGKWFFVDNAFLRDGWGAEVGSSGIAVYVALAMHAGVNSQVCWPSYRTLASLAGMSRCQAMRAVKLLERHNLIRVVRRERNQSNLYVLLHPDQWKYVQSDSASAEVVSHRHYHPAGRRCERPSGVAVRDHLREESRWERPGGVATSDSNKTHEQDTQKEQDDSGVDDSLTTMWQAVLSELRLQMTKATFETWLGRSRATGLENGVLTVTVPNRYAQEWCATRLLSTIRRTLRDTTGEDLEIEFQIKAAELSHSYQGDG